MGRLKQIKSKEDRVREGISLLKQLRDSGVRENLGGFQELKSRISEWVSSDTGWEGTILFPEHGRIAEVELPRYDNKAAGINFKQKKFY
jgi:hypothetical protein